MGNFPLKEKCHGLNTITKKYLALSSLLTFWKSNSEWIWIKTWVHVNELFPEQWQKWWRSTSIGKLAWKSCLCSAVRPAPALLPGRECSFCLAVIAVTQLLISQLFSLWKAAASFCLCYESGAAPPRAVVMCRQGKESALQKEAAAGCLSSSVWPPRGNSLVNEEQSQDGCKHARFERGNKK